MAKLLSDLAVEEAAKGLNGQLRTYGCNGKPPDKDLRQAAAEIAAAVPLTAVNLPWLLAAAGPEVARAVRAQARAMAGSRVGGDAGSLAPSVLLSATEAAGKAGVSDRAVRAACADGRLVASRDRITGTWRITAPALDEWTRRRHAA